MKDGNIFARSRVFPATGIIQFDIVHEPDGCPDGGRTCLVRNDDVANTLWFQVSPGARGFGEEIPVLHGQSFSIGYDDGVKISSIRLRGTATSAFLVVICEGRDYEGVLAVAKEHEKAVELLAGDEE